MFIKYYVCIFRVNLLRLLILLVFFKLLRRRSFGHFTERNPFSGYFGR